MIEIKWTFYIKVLRKVKLEDDIIIHRAKRKKEEIVQIVVVPLKTRRIKLSRDQLKQINKIYIQSETIDFIFFKKKQMRTMIKNWVFLIDSKLLIAHQLGCPESG